MIRSPCTFIISWRTIVANGSVYGEHVTPPIIINLFLPNVRTVYLSIAMILSIIIATGSWFFLSHESYYDDQQRAYSYQRDYFKNVLTNIDAAEQKGNITDLSVLKSIFHYNERGKNTDGTKATIIVKKDNETIVNIKSNRNKGNNPYILEVSANSNLNPTKDRKIVKPTVNDELKVGNKFKLIYEYYNRPEITTGFIRAITFSSLKDEEHKISLASNRSWFGYIKAYLYERSVNFWLMFYACFFVAIAISYMLGEYEREKKDKEKEEKHRKELEIANDKLAAANKKLDRFKLMYQKMFEEYEMAGIDDNKQVLQRIDFTWPKMLSNILADDRHDLKNDLLNISTTLKGPKKELYDEIIGKAKEDILNNLRRLPDIISYETTLIPVQDVIAGLNTQLESLLSIYKKNDDVKFTFNNIVPGNAQGKCDVNIYRLKSMVVNILNNASQACQDCSIKAMHNYKDFVERLTLSYSLCEKEGQHYLRVAVKDNAGGIPEELLSDLYVNPVTSREGNRQGEGTMYVAFFAEYMDILIEKSNWSSDEDKGAEIALLIPIKGEESNG